MSLKAQVNNTTYGGGIPFSYTLSSSSKTSAGVFKPDSTLVRTLWSNEQKPAGTHTASWDGKNDGGVLMPDGNYQIKVLTNNVTYNWEGKVGNSSDSSSGTAVHHLAAGIFVDMRIAGTKALYAANYNEHAAAEFSFNRAAPNVKIPVWSNWPFTTAMITSKVCTDGVRFYLGGHTNSYFTPGVYGSFVIALNTSDFSQVNFSSGQAYQPAGSVFQYSSAIDQKTGNDTAHSVNGMAVQKTGIYLFVSRTDLNSVHVINKNTGTLVHSLTYSKPGYIDTDASGNLWMINGTDVKKYIVNGDGTLSGSNIMLTGLVKPLAVQVTPDGTKVYVADGGSSQNVKIYSNTTGTLLSTFGQAGGYASSPVVKNDKFMFQTGKSFGSAGEEYSFITFDSTDGSWWIGDIGNGRAQHYSSNNVFIDRIMNVGYHYSASVDYNNTARVFANYLEFEIDYTKPLLPNNGSWKLVKNWSQNVTFANDDQFTRLRGVHTLNNNKTYATNGGSSGLWQLVELADTGLRFTGQTLSYGAVLQSDGSLWSYSPGSTTVWKRQLLTGFDASNNPVWGSAVTMASIAGSPDNSPLDGGGAGFRPHQVGAAGLITYFNPEGSGGYHLGAIKADGNSWLWRTSPSTHRNYSGEFPDDGVYDLGNGVNYAGGGMQVLEKSIFWNYKGENWKQAQTNKHNHYYDNGLMVGQFGITQEFAKSLASEAYPMMGGNVMAPIVIKAANDYYMYHNDESYHGGVHRWKITGLNTIAVQTVPVIKSGTPPAPVYDYVDLLAGLPFDDTLTNNTAGWTRFAPESERFKIKTSLSTYKREDRDLHIFSIGQNVDCWVKRDLGTNTGLTNWKIVGEMSYPEGGEYGDNFMEVLDANERIIVRISRPENYPSLEIKANSSRIAFGPEVYGVAYKLRPLSIVANGSSITVKYADYNSVTVNVFDPLANATNPTILRFYTVSHPAAHQINVARLKFYKNFGLNLGLGHFRSKGSGLWKNLSNWQSSADSISWADATAIPNNTTNSIVIQNGHYITLTDTATVDQLTIQNSGGLKVAPNALLVVNDGPGNDITVAGSGSMIIQSDATGTGRIGNSSGNVSGNVTVERYISSNDNKAYRLLAPSVNTVNGVKPFIRNNWQEGQNNGSMLTNSNSAPNYGMHITGSMTGANGFDATLTGSPSLLYYNQTASTPAWASVANTNATNFDVKKGYLVYIRGDRGTDLHNNNTSSNTTLRTTGSIATGIQTFASQEGNGRSSLVTNPYPCPVDWSTIYNDAATQNAANFENFYTYWDPHVGMSGGYVTVKANGIKSAANNATTEIQPGQAFFIKAKPGIASPTFTIKENHKSGAGNIDVFRTGAREQFRTTLYFSDANATRRMADAVNAVFDTAFSAAIDGNDAEEMANWDENVAISRAAKMISIEGRPLIDLTDTLHLTVQRLKMQNYEWQFEPMGFALPNLRAYLEDKYTNFRTQISLTSVSVISFSVNAFPASSAPDRFRIVFAVNSSLPVTMRSIKAYQKGTGIQVDWTTEHEYNINRYEVEKSNDGRQFTKAGIVLPNTTGNSIHSYNWFDQYPKEGNNYYRIKTVDQNGTISYSGIVNVKIGGTSESFEVYPNPVTGNLLMIQFNNLKRGSYTVSLVDAMGHKVVSKAIVHPGGSASQSIITDNSLPAGSYNLQIKGNGIIFNKKIIK